jgi:hypothetical protein
MITHFDAEQDFEFYFDMGMAPEIALNLSELPPCFPLSDWCR